MFFSAAAREGRKRAFEFASSSSSSSFSSRRFVFFSDVVTTTTQKSSSSFSSSSRFRGLQSSSAGGGGGGGRHRSSVMRTEEGALARVRREEEKLRGGKISENLRQQQQQQQQNGRRRFASDATAVAGERRGEEFRLLPKICSIANLKLNETKFFQKTIPFLRCTSSSSRNGMTLTELCGHSAFVLLGWSYVVDDPFLLRCLATASFTAQICFQFFREKPLWLPIRWNVLFVGVNMIWIAKMLNEYSEKSLKDLSSEEREVYDAFFKVKEKEVVTMSSSEVEETKDSRGEKVVSAAPKKTTKTYRTHQIHPSDFKELVKLGEWKELKEGEVIAVKGKVNKNIYAIVDGSAMLTLDDVAMPVAASVREKTAATTTKTASSSSSAGKNILRRGKFVGEMALSHGAAFGTVVVQKEGAKVMVWDTNKLREFVAENPRAMNSVQASFGRSLVEKMKIVGME